VPTHDGLLDGQFDRAAVHRGKRLGHLADLVQAAYRRHRHRDVRLLGRFHHAQPPDHVGQLQLGDLQRLPTQLPERAVHRAADRVRRQQRDQQHGHDPARGEQGTAQLRIPVRLGRRDGLGEQPDLHLAQLLLLAAADGPPLRDVQAHCPAAGFGDRVIGELAGPAEGRRGRYRVVPPQLLVRRGGSEVGDGGHPVGPQVGEFDELTGAEPPGAGGAEEPAANL
jgi:hypothetical protein